MRAASRPGRTFIKPLDIPDDLERVAFATSLVVHYGRPGDTKPVCGSTAADWVLFSVYETGHSYLFDQAPTCQRCAGHVEETTA